MKEGIKVEQNLIEKIGFSHLWEMHVNNIAFDCFLAGKNKYEGDQYRSVELFCDYEYGHNLVDLDNSKYDELSVNTRSPIIDEIYMLLWGKKKKKDKDNLVDENGYTVFRKTYIFGNILMGGETLNSLQSSINDKISKSRKDLKNEYETNKKCVHKMVLEARLSDNCESNCYIGNYVIVPAYFNGSCKGYKDRWVTRMPTLKNNWFLKEKLINYYRGKKYSKEKLQNLCEKNQYEDYTGECFFKYVNTMFLWDYVTIDEENECYEVVPDEINLDNFLYMCNSRIKRRSLFMAAMIHIANDAMFEKKAYQERAEWDEWQVSYIYKKIMNEVFLINHCYKDYSEVINKIEDVIKSETMIDDERSAVNDAVETLKNDLK